jgi:hypothetical protein
MAKGDFVGEFELYVLLALAHQGEEAMASQSGERSKLAPAGRLRSGRLATLARLEDGGSCAPDFDPQPQPGGARQKAQSDRGGRSRASSFHQDARA